MGRIMAIDYGTKRVGIAVTDPLQIVVSPMTTVATENAIEFIYDYCQKEEVERIVLGLPLRLNGEETHATQPAIEFGRRLKKKLSHIPIDHENEQFSSKLAVKSMLKSGIKKKERRKKENIDKVSAAIILQSYLDR